MGVKISLAGTVFNSLRYVLRNGIAGSYDISIFNFFEELYPTVAVTFYILRMCEASNVSLSS